MTKCVGSILITLLWAITVSGTLSVTSVPSAEAAELCPHVAATLTPYIGDPSQTNSGQRVELRQCPLNSDIGTIQLVGWGAGDSTPSLVVDTELRSLKQLVMVRGAYAFELVSASASGVIGIVFEKGKPRQALSESTKGTVLINTEGATIKIELDDGSGPKRTRVLKGEFWRQ